MHYFIFFLFFILLWFMLPFHFFSVEHLNLQKKFGINVGNRIAKIFGLISGWGFFISLFGVWLSPQPRFYFPIFHNIILTIQIIDLNILLVHMILSIPFIILGAWLGISGVKATSLKVSETHKAEKIIKSKVYSKLRHPQYLGAILSHIGISILFSSLYSLIITPLIIFYNYIISWKEEKELIKEFGKEYEEYKSQVPMFIPRLKKK